MNTVIRKTISGHYGMSFSLEHNNRSFIPQNCDPGRIPWNYNLVESGAEVHIDVDEYRFAAECWGRYREISEDYWSDRALARQFAYEQYQRELEHLRRWRKRSHFEAYGLAGAVVLLLFMPVIIAHDVYMDRRFEAAKAEWETVLKYLNTCSDEEYEQLFHRARQHLDYLPSREKAKAMRTLEEIIQKAKTTAAQQTPTKGKHPPEKRK